MPQLVRGRRPGRKGLLRAALLLGALTLAAWPSAALAVNRPHWSPGVPWAPLHPHSSEMRQISDLFWIMLVISGVIFAAVCAALIISIVRNTARPGQPEPAQVFGNRTVELAWTIIPTLILVVAFIVTAKYINNINSPPKGSTSADVMNVEVIGHQWWWEFRYPPQPQVARFGINNVLIAANELHLPTGIPLHFHVTSADVVHSFWTPQLQRQVDANPGIDNAVFVEFKPGEEGVYAGDCYEYCGTAHAWMKYEVVVETPSQFRAWVKAQLAYAAKPTTALTRYGQTVFTRNTCDQCHVITYPGSPAHGVVGPNLTHVASRWSIAAGATPLTPSDVAAWIQNPQTYKEGVLMPPYPFLSKHDLQALAAYIMSLK